MTNPGRAYKILLLASMFTVVSAMNCLGQKSNATSGSATIRPETSWTMATLVAKANRNRKKDRVVEMPGGTVAFIPARVAKTNLKPNPLTLIVGIQANGELTVNSEVHGSLKDPQPLVEFLRMVFKDREQNGVYRPNSNEVETSVFLRARLASSIADVDTATAAIRDAGSMAIGLQVDLLPE